MIRVISTSESDDLTNFTCQVILGSISNDLTSLHTSESPQNHEKALETCMLAWGFLRWHDFCHVSPKEVRCGTWVWNHLQWFIFKKLLEKKTFDTIDGRNPAPVEVGLFIPLFTTVYLNIQTLVVGGISEPSTAGMIFSQSCLTFVRSFLNSSTKSLTSCKEMWRSGGVCGLDVGA